MEYSNILNIQDLKEREILLREHWTAKLKIQKYNTGRLTIITEEEYKEYIEIFVEYGLDFKKFPADHPKFPNFPMVQTIRDYFDYEAKVHGYETYKEFAKWLYANPWKPSGMLHYCEMKYSD